jgi:hypothetical protein
MPDHAESQHRRQWHRERNLLRSDGGTERIELVGVVHPVTGLLPSPFSKHWQLRMQLLAWRTPGGPIEFGELTLVMQASKREVEAAAAPVQPFALVRLGVRMAEPEPGLDPFAVLVEPPAIGADPDMARVAEELKRPVTFEIADLGMFTLDRSANWFEASTLWRGQPVQVALSMDDHVSRELQIQRARNLWAEFDAWFRHAVDFAIADLLQVKNEAWLDENQPPIEAGTFERALRIESVTIQSDGSVDLWFDDGDLFWGHSIMVACTPAGSPTRTELCG